MKKLCVLLALVLLSSFFIVPVSAVHSDFDVRSGVLVKYSGSEENVTIPETVFEIGAGAFENNTSLRSVKLHDKVYAIGDRAFYGCTSLSTVSGGNNVGRVGDLAFRYAPYLEKSTDKYLMLGNTLLWYNGTSDSVSIPVRCTAVASYAFARCSYLKSFTANEGLISIGTGAFYACGALSEVNIPSTVSEIGAYAFDGTPYLENAGEYAVSGDGVLVRYQGTDTAVKVPENVKRIAPHAFISSKTRSVTIPESVYSIDPYAFADCVGLEKVTFNDGLVMIGDGAFRGCKALSEVDTPPTLSYLGQGAFGGDSSLKGASVCGNELTLSYNAFKGCTGLNYVHLSDGVTDILDNAFDGCTALEGVSVAPNTAHFSSQALSGCDKAVLCCEKNSVAASAFSKINTVMGDADSDESLTILDSSMIQLYIVRLYDLNGTQIASSDINFDGFVDILDAFEIQLKIASLK